MVTATVVCTRLLNCLLLVAIFLGGEARAQMATARSWTQGAEIQDGCLLLDHTNFTGAQTAASSKPEAQRHLGSQELLESIAQQITYGITSGSDAAGCLVNNHHSSVDLTVFIANHVDNQWMSQDEYWQYYLHCDQWGVVLNEPADVELDETLVEAKPNSSLIELGGEFLSNASLWASQKYQQYEFVCVEQMAEMQTGLNETGFPMDAKTSPVEHIASKTPSVGMYEILRQEMASRWEPVFRWFGRLAKESRAVPVAHLLDDLLFDPFAELPVDVVLIESELDDLH